VNSVFWALAKDGMKLEIATTCDPDYWQAIRIVK